MTSSKARVWILVGLGLVLIVLLLWLPKVPASEKAGDVLPTDADSLKLMQAVELVNSENPMQGIQMLLEIVKKDSTNTLAQMYLGQFAVQSGQMYKALNRFDLVTRTDPGNASAQFEKGYVLLQLDSLEAALKSFDAGLALEPDNINGLFFSAQCSELLEHWPEAKGYYMKVLELNTDTVIEKKVNEFVQNIDKKLNP